MASLKIFDRSGSEVGSYEIEPTDIAPRISNQLLHDVVVMYQANQRQGSAKSKTRAEVAGSTKKMYRQKGTGNARAGSRRSGIRRGGGHIFAKQPRDYSYRMPKKAVRLATRMAIASKVRDGQMVVIDDLGLSRPATKEMAGILKALGLGAKTALVTTEQLDVNAYKSGRNLAGVDVSAVEGLNALSVLRPEYMVVTKSALDAIKAKSHAAMSRSADGAEEVAAASV